ncbi:MAG: hypothetical protein ABR564_01835 [Candidatus Dormibacteria bacterium]
MDDPHDATSPPSAPNSAVRPGAGAPIVPGPPQSVRGPVSSRRLNASLGIAGGLLLVGVAVVVILLFVLVIILIRR